MTDAPSPLPPRPSPLGDGSVTTAILNGVATIEFSHPKGNSMPGTLLRRLAEEIDVAGARTDARAIVLRSGGSGPFCGGASFDELKALRNAEDGRTFFSGFSKVIMAIKRSPRMVIARVHGKVAGGGVGIAAAADYAIAVKAASCRLSEIALGIAPFVIGPAVERKLGAGAFAAMSFDAEWRDADWCERHGLYAKVVDDLPALDAAVTALAERIAVSNPDAVRQLKEVSWRGTDHFEALMEERAGMSGALALSKFTRDAIAAFEART